MRPSLRRLFLAAFIGSSSVIAVTSDTAADEPPPNGLGPAGSFSAQVWDHVESTKLAAYALPISVAQGESVHIYVSTTAPVFDLRVVREGWPTKELLWLSDLPGMTQPVPHEAWKNGCAWSASYTLHVSADWPSGVYVCEFRVNRNVAGYALFTVREDQPGSTSSVLLQTANSTWQAYNGFGGKSLYAFNSTDGERAHVVSFERPHNIANGLGDFYYAERPFVRWLDMQGLRVEFCADVDLHREPGFLDPYELLLVVGHDEYWSKEKRDRVEAFVAKGHNVAMFSGNTCWRQVRFSSALDQIICYKDASLDPLTRIDDARVTVRWHEDPVLRPENILTGVSWRHGGFVNAFGWYPESEGYGGYTAYNTDHWVFAGTGLTDGAVFGQAATIVGYEVDGALFRWDGDVPVATGEDSTSTSFVILGISPASSGHATMGLFTNGGTVFNAATTDWAHGLATDTTVARITRNVLHALSERRDHDDDPPTAPAFPVGQVLAVPNPVNASVTLEWIGPLGAPATVRVHSLDGRLVAVLPVDGSAAAGSITWNGRDRHGRAVSGGLYMARVVGTRASGVAKLTIVR